MDQQMQECIDTCQSCRQVCLETLHYSEQQGGEYAREEHLRLLQDCAKICETSADFMRRDSEFHARTCTICAEICQRCAASCDTFTGDEQMQKCAQACRDCAASCRQTSIS